MKEIILNASSEINIKIGDEYPLTTVSFIECKKEPLEPIELTAKHFTIQILGNNLEALKNIIKSICVNLFLKKDNILSICPFRYIVSDSGKNPVYKYVITYELNLYTYLHIKNINNVKIVVEIADGISIEGVLFISTLAGYKTF